MVTNSETTKRQLAKIAGSKNVRVIPNGVDIEYIDRIVPSPERPDVLFAGRLIKEKNVDLLIRSIGILRETHPAVQCLIVGEGPERERLERLVGELDLNSNVRFTGFADNWSEVLSYMKSSKVFVLPSVREGFGMVVLEANACGLPVITVRHPQNAACDLVVDGQTGYIAEFSEQDVSEKVVQVIDQKEKWASDCMALAQGYDWNEITSETEAYYLNGIGRQKTVTR